jgi:hypothetical protein
LAVEFRKGRVQAGSRLGVTLKGTSQAALFSFEVPQFVFDTDCLDGVLDRLNEPADLSVDLGDFT